MKIDFLGIKDFNYYENTYTRAGNKYEVKELIELAEKEDHFDLPLAGIDIGVQPWGDIDIKHFAYHMRRVNNAEMKYPVILDDTGFICDGWHRVVRAIIEGKTTIKAVRLKVMPEPIEVND